MSETVLMDEAPVATVTPPGAAPGRGQPGAGLSGPKSGAEYNLYFSPEIWNARVGRGAETAPELRKAFDALGESWSAAFREFLKVKEDSDPRLSDFARRERIHQRAVPPIEKAADAAERALEAAGRQASELRTEAAAKLRQRAPEAALAGEIRAYVRSLPEGERIGFLNRAAETGDLASLAAVLGAPAYLSGIDPKRFEAVHERVLRELAPQEAAKVERLAKGAALVRQRAADLRTWATKDFAAPTPPKGAA